RPCRPRTGPGARPPASAASDVVQGRTLHAHAPVPVVEALVQHRQQFQRVPRRRVGHAKRLGADQPHEHALLLAPRPREGAPVGGGVELLQERGQPPGRPPLPSAAHGCPPSAASPPLPACASRPWRMASRASNDTHSAATRITRSMPRRSQFLCSRKVPSCTTSAYTDITSRNASGTRVYTGLRPLRIRITETTARVSAASSWLVVPNSGQITMPPLPSLPA